MIVSVTSCHRECPAPAESPASRQCSEPGLYYTPLSSIAVSRQLLTWESSIFDIHLSPERTPGLGAVNIDRGAARGNLQILRLCTFFQEFCARNKISWNIARMESWNWIYFKLPRYLFWRYTISRQSLSLKDLGLNTKSACPNQTSSRLPGAWLEWLLTILWFLFIAQCTNSQVWLFVPVYSQWSHSLVWLTLRAEWSAMEQLVWSVTSATDPASDTMNT